MLVFADPQDHAMTQLDAELGTDSARKKLIFFSTSDTFSSMYFFFPCFWGNDANDAADREFISQIVMAFLFSLWATDPIVGNMIFTSSA